MALKHGIDASCYINTGTFAAPVWSEIDLISNLTPNGGWDAAEINIRRSRVKFGAKTNLDLGFSARVLCDDADPNYLLLIAAWQSLTGTVDLLILDAPITSVGAFGYRGDFQLTAGNQDQPTTDVLYRDFEGKPYPILNQPPTWAQVNPGPTLVFTPI